MTGLAPPSGFRSGLDLGSRFEWTLARDGVLTRGDTLVVALSGGVDSTVLLHLLRFSPNVPSFRILAAHFDHRMRPGSSADSLWVSGLCRAWGIPLYTGEPAAPPTSEDEAREERYRFLLAVKSREEAGWVLTGHQGDDQAETVLFRILRGTGLRGLAGIPNQREPGIYRPLLAFSRDELSDYAVANRIRFLDDPTNRDLTYPRNFLRHRLLPQLLKGPAPGARDSLRRLARLARENEEAWESLLPRLLDGVLVEEGGAAFIVRSGLHAYHPALQTKLLREIFRTLGVGLDEAGTRAAVEFTRTGTSGQSISLPGGVRLAREFDRFRVGEAGVSEGQEPLVLPRPEPGSASFSVGGRSYQAIWGAEKPDACEAKVALPVPGVEFPLLLRQWEPGDRIQLAYGTKKLKKLFSEARIPVEDRGRTPILVDAEGRVLWVAGLVSSVLIGVRSGAGALFLGIRNVDTS
jgi:tRNA(Ile)-lysidine synthase